MIVAERKIHHRTDIHLPIHGYGSRHDFVHAENSTLRKIQNRRGKKRSIHSAVCDGECAALQIFDLEFSIARSCSVIGNIAFEVGKTFLVRITHDRHNQSAFGADGYTDVVEVVLNKIVAFDAAVDDRHGLERLHTSLNKERHQTEFYAVLFGELLLFAAA